MTSPRPSCPQHSDSISWSTTRAGRRVWCCMRCGRVLGPAPLSSAYGWEEVLEIHGEKAAEAHARGQRQLFLQLTGRGAPSAPEPEMEAEAEESPSIQPPAPPPVRPPPAPPAPPPPPRRAAPVPQPVAASAPPSLPEQPRIAVHHHSTCRKEPCSCAAHLRAIEKEARLLAAEHLRGLSDFDRYHPDDREAVRGYLMRIIVRLTERPVC